MGSLSFFLLTYALIKIEVTESFLLNCKYIGYDIAEEWFIQGQLYSYCTYLKVEEGQQPSSILVDESCNSVICYECMKACNASKPFNLINCLSDCNSTSCEFGCKFYTYLSGATNESFQTNVQNMPYIDSSFKVNPTEVQDLSITFQWPVVTSKFNFTKSIYLLTITVNQEENTYEVVLGLASENMYIMLEENFCFYGDVNYYRPGVTFQVNVYPINYNGYNTSTTITSNFTNLTEVHKHTALGLYKETLNTLEKNKIKLNQCRGQPYNGVNVKSGLYNGIQSLLKQDEPIAIYLHCATHNLNLDINDAVKSCHKVCQSKFCRRYHRTSVIYDATCY